ncbi:MAG: FAD-dependent oxidoreductase [Rhodobacteraceae bacterium]|nr:FAD-dependent oxidoreductase [Paracoccaceae bacterium]
MTAYDYDVVIVGSGPAGIGAATALSRAGVKNIVVFDRETEIGGIPRHTHHASFGLLVFKRPLKGPKYIRALIKRCPDVQFQTSTTVTALHKDGIIEIATPDGMETIRARHIILATGARETPRHGRLTSGLRPQGVMTTGALQQFVYGAKLRPFKRAVIVGTELVSFSALWTLRSAGIKPVAMIEENPRITAYRPATLFARLLRVPIHYNSQITDISGISELREIRIGTHSGQHRTIACDGVIFSGKFVGDNNIARASHLTESSTTQIPKVDQNWISSDPKVSIIGNAVHPADMGDQCYIEGVSAGQTVAKILQDGPDAGGIIEITHGKGIKMATPNILRPRQGESTSIDISLHVAAPYTGTIVVKFEDEVIYAKSKRCMPARRITLKNVTLNVTDSDPAHHIHISLADI